MKILIAADMEGISGVVNWNQVSPDHTEYARFRQVMTADINAAIHGAFEAGANEVIVADGHANGNNILIEELDSRARLNTGNPSPLNMVQGIDPSFDGAFFIGYHARAGTQNAILCHTWSDKCVANLWLNDRLTGETGLNAAVCGHFGVPVLMVSGDQAVCDEAKDVFESVEVTVVKKASSRMAAECLSLASSQSKIHDTALKAVSRLVIGRAPKPLQMKPPVVITIEFHYPQMADIACLIPGAARLDGCRIRFTAEDILKAYSGMRAAVGLARGL